MKILIRDTRAYYEEELQKQTGRRSREAIKLHTHKGTHIHPHSQCIAAIETAVGFWTWKMEL